MNKQIIPFYLSSSLPSIPQLLSFFFFFFFFILPLSPPFVSLLAFNSRLKIYSRAQAFGSDERPHHWHCEHSNGQPHQPQREPITTEAGLLVQRQRLNIPAKNAFKYF